jgi:hypothetical protein
MSTQKLPLSIDSIVTLVERNPDLQEGVPKLAEKMIWQWCRNALDQLFTAVDPPRIKEIQGTIEKTCTRMTLAAEMHALSVMKDDRVGWPTPGKEEIDIFDSPAYAAFGKKYDKAVLWAEEFRSVAIVLVEAMDELAQADTDQSRTDALSHVLSLAAELRRLGEGEQPPLAEETEQFVREVVVSMTPAARERHMAIAAKLMLPPDAPEPATDREKRKRLQRQRIITASLGRAVVALMEPSEKKKEWTAPSIKDPGLWLIACIGAAAAELGEADIALLAGDHAKAQSRAASAEVLLRQAHQDYPDTDIIEIISEKLGYSSDLLNVSISTQKTCAELRQG